MRIRIESKGHVSRFFNPETGEEIPGVVSATWEHPSPDDLPRIRLEVLDVDASLEAIAVVKPVQKESMRLLILNTALDLYCFGAWRRSLELADAFDLHVWHCEETENGYSFQRLSLKEAIEGKLPRESLRARAPW